MTLPENMDPTDFDENFRLQPELWQKEVLMLCKNWLLRLRAVLNEDGSNLVAAINEKYVVKIFPDFHRHQWVIEHSILSKLQSRTKIPVPKLFKRESYLKMGSRCH